MQFTGPGSALRGVPIKDRDPQVRQHPPTALGLPRGRGDYVGHFANGSSLDKSLSPLGIGLGILAAEYGLTTHHRVEDC